MALPAGYTIEPERNNGKNEFAVRIPSGEKLQLAHSTKVGAEQYANSHLKFMSRKDSISPARIPTQLDPMKVDLLGRAVDALGKRFDAMCGKRADAEGIKIPMPKDPKERAEYEAAIAARKARGGGRFVGDE